MRTDQDKNFSELIKKYEKALWRVAATYEARPAIRDELFQEILFELWKALKSFKGNSSYKTYIYRVAHNVAFKHVSRQVKGKSAASFSAEFKKEVSAEKIHIAKQNADGLSSAIRLLPLKQREVLSLFLEGLTYQEISEIIGVSHSNTGVILNRAKNQL